MTQDITPELGTEFNFAQYILSCNVDRPEKIAYIDDLGTLSYGDLADRIQRFAAGLSVLDVRREERVLLLMHDSSDWAVCFLGAMYAGVVPVALNTLLTAEDYAYMLEDCSAQTVIVSSALLPIIQSAISVSNIEVKHIIVAGPEAELPEPCLSLDSFIEQQTPLNKPAATGPDDIGFWLYSSGIRIGQPSYTVNAL